MSIPAVHAQSAASAPEQTLDEEHVTANALPTTAVAATQHITMLRRADLDAMRGQSLSEILSRQAGVVIDRGPRSGGYGALYLRGADPSHVVVLIDHVRQNDSLSSRGSAVDLNTLSTDDIERIEIVRGNASIANPDAMAGLIHIFTRQAGSSGGASGSVGTEGLRAGQVSWSGTQWDIGAAQREDSDDHGGFHRTRAANAGWDREIGEDGSLRAAVRITDSENRGFPDDSGGADYAVLRALETRHAETRQVSLRGTYRPTTGTLEAQLATFSRDGEDESPGVLPGARDPFGLPALTARTDYRRDELQAVWRMPLGDSMLLGAGLQVQREHGRFDSRIDFGFFVLPAAFELRRRTESAFTELRWQRGDWIVQGGLRHERTRDDDTEAVTHPMLSIQRALGEGRGQWGVSAARSSKAPSFYALGHPLVGNPELRPERVLHREVYYATDAASLWPTRVTLFSARYRDLVDFDAGPPPQLINRARIEADGIEWRSGRRFDNEWRVQVDGTWMRVRDPQGTVELRHRPKLQAGVQLGMPVGEHRELSLMLRYLGRRFDSSIPTGDRWLRATTTLDLGFRQRWGAAQALISIDNLTDANGEDAIGIDSPGRRVRVSLQWAMR